MKSRYIAAKLFVVLAAFCALVGIALFQYDLNGSGLTAPDYLNPLMFVMLPKLIPFAAAILSASFGLLYFGLERNFRRPPNIPLVLVHLVSYLLAILGHVTLVRFWWRVLGDEHANIPLPIWAGGLEVTAFVVCCLAIATNVFSSFSTAVNVAVNPR